MPEYIAKERAMDCVYEAVKVTDANAQDLYAIRRKIANEPGIGWVSVKDRLPEEDADVLVWNELGIEIAAYTTNPVKQWYAYTGQDVFVKYWMPLPEPPEVSKDANGD